MFIVMESPGMRISNPNKMIAIKINVKDSSSRLSLFRVFFVIRLTKPMIIRSSMIYAKLLLIAFHIVGGGSTPKPLNTSGSLASGLKISFKLL